MPGITADKIIGKNLFAKKRIEKLNGSLNPIGIFAPGQLVGTVYSWITRNGKVYWMFNTLSGSFYYVLHDPNAFKFSADVQAALDEMKAEKEKEIINTKGAIPYYIEKYGKILLLSVAGFYLFKLLIAKNEK